MTERNFIPDFPPEEKDQGNAEIFTLLGEVTLPTFAKHLIAEKSKNSFHVQVMREKIEALEQKYGSSEENRSWLDSEKAKLMAHIKKSEEEYIEDTFTDLCNRSTMIEYRDQAQELYANYQKKIDAGMQFHSTVDAYFVREAAKLNQETRKFINDFLRSEGGRFIALDISGDTDTVVKTLQHKIERALEIQEGAKKETIEITIGSRRTSDWDAEEIHLDFDDENSITKIRLDERFSYTANCERIEQLKEAYQQGQEITFAQRQLLIDRGLIEPSEEGYEEDSHDILRVPTDTRFPHSPIFAFPYSLPKHLSDIASKISARDFYLPAKADTGGIKVNCRRHDYGEDQYAINLFPGDELTEEECYEVIRAQIEAVKQFPIVPRPAKSGSEINQ